MIPKGNTKASKKEAGFRTIGKPKLNFSSDSRPKVSVSEGAGPQSEPHQTSSKSSDTLAALSEELLKLVETASSAQSEASIEDPATPEQHNASRIEQSSPKNVYSDGSELGIVNKNFSSTYVPEEIGLLNLGAPEELVQKLELVGYQCSTEIATQMSLLLNTPTVSIRTVLLEGPPGCGKSFLAKSLSKISGAELMCLSCFKGMNLQHLLEYPSTLALANAMTGKGGDGANDLLNLGILSRAYLASQTKPVILLVDEIDKVDVAIDTFFLGPIQDARIWLESRAPIDANVNNLLIMFTKNFERNLNDALLRRVQPLRMSFLDSTLERKVLAPHCDERLVSNLVRVADIMRYSEGSYPFDRPPAPEELLKIGKYIAQLLSWGKTDFAFVGRNIWFMVSKSEHDRAILERMLRYHPDFFDPLVPDGRKASIEQVHARLGRVVLEGIVDDPDAGSRASAYRPEEIGLTKVGDPKTLARRLGDVGYQCLPFIASQISLILNTPSERTRAVLLEGPSGCGKSYLAKCLSKISGAELMCLSCYRDMHTAHLIEAPSTLAMAKSMSHNDETPKEKLMNLGILSRAFLKSQNHPVILLVDEIDKVEAHIDTFFLGPIQDARIWLESRPPIDANIDNLLVVFTKNFNRVLDAALLRRLHPIRMSYLDSTLERRILSKQCFPQLVDNLVSIADRMRESNGSYAFERPPAPEELLTGGQYIGKLLEWGYMDFAWIGRNVWAILAKSEHDRAVLEHMMRFHPDFLDPLVPDGRNAPIEEIYGKLGRIILKGIVADPKDEARARAWEDMEYN